MNTKNAVQTTHDRTIIMRTANDPSLVQGKPAPPPLAYEQRNHGTFVSEKDVAITLRDGTTIYVDVYRPSWHANQLAVLLAWGPYGKHWTTSRMFTGSGVEPDWISEFTAFESPDPAYWTAHGYAVVFADPRGLWHSEGEYSHNGPQERDDLYDAIEFLGAAPWSNGNVGMLGVSYLAGSQYQAASVRPPSLKAISPWECFLDWYREFATHGGIPETGFTARVTTNISWGKSRTEDTSANLVAHPLDDWYYADKYGENGDIEIPAYVVASWSDHGLHSRGSLQFFDAISSDSKWLEVHGDKKWAHFYHPSSVERQREFFDTFLLGLDRGMDDWPRVRFEVRDTGEPRDSQWVEASALPAIDQFDEFHFDATTQRIQTASPQHSSSITFDPLEGSVDFRFEFEEVRSIVGPMSLALSLSCDGASDADVFVIVRKLRSDGSEVLYPINSLFADGPVALGWLRASHRAVDESKSTPLVPFHPHDREHLLEAGEIVQLDIEIWPSGTVFHAGESLIVTVQGRDWIHRPPAQGVPPLQILHDRTRNAGAWTIHTGPQHPSILRVPAAELDV